MSKTIFVSVLLALIFTQLCFSQQLVKSNSLTFNSFLWATLNQGPDNDVSYTGYITDNQVLFYPLNSDPASPPVAFSRPIFSKGYMSVAFTQTWFDADTGWEKIFSYYSADENQVLLFSLVDDNGTVILSDTGDAYPFLYNSTIYLTSSWQIDNSDNADSLAIFHEKFWKFPSNFITGSPALAKKSQTSFSSRYVPASRRYKLDITAQSQSPLDIRLLDMQGRTIFRRNQTISKGTHHFTFPIDVSPGVLISDIKSANERKSDKFIPVH